VMMSTCWTARACAAARTHSRQPPRSLSTDLHWLRAMDCRASACRPCRDPPWLSGLELVLLLLVCLLLCHTCASTVSATSS
jgi:hypothetical protein